MTYFQFLAQLLVGLALLSAQEQTFASPLQPWDGYNCAAVRQWDHKKIGAVCLGYDHILQVSILDVYYFGILWQNKDKYSYFYSNLSLNGSYFSLRGLDRKTFGDGNNLPREEVLTSRYITSTSFGLSHYAENKPFQIFFQAEQKPPVTANPPFDYDNLYGENYRATLPPRK